MPFASGEPQRLGSCEAIGRVLQRGGFRGCCRPAFPVYSVRAKALFEGPGVITLDGVECEVVCPPPPLPPSPVGGCFG